MPTTKIQNDDSFEHFMIREQTTVQLLAEACFRFLFLDEDNDIFNLLEPLEGDQDEQIGLLMDFLDVEEIPADKPEKLDPLFWAILTNYCSDTSHTLAMARLAAIVGLLCCHQSFEFLLKGSRGNSILTYGQAQMMLGRAYAMGESYYGRDSVIANAQRAVAARLRKDPKQLDKKTVRECWELWQNEPARYKSNAAFARDMLQKYETLTSQPVIERWCREWKEESGTQPAK